MRRARRVRRCALVGVLAVLAGASCATTGGGYPTDERLPPAYKPLPTQPLYRIEVEDAVEAALVQQQLKVDPQRVEGRAFYYLGDERTNAALRELGYQPERADARSTFTRVVRVRRRGDERRLADYGVRVILRERGYWIARGSVGQLDALRRGGLRVELLQPGDEPRPRQVRVLAPDRQTVRDVVARQVDIYSVEGGEREGKGLTVNGAAFDDQIDELRARGLHVDVLPDPPEVKR